MTGAIDHDYATADELGRLQEMGFRVPYGDQADRYRELHQSMKDFITDVVHYCPPSREKSLAITKAEEARMWAVAAIAKNEGGKIDQTFRSPQEPEIKVGDEVFIEGIGYVRLTARTGVDQFSGDIIDQAKLVGAPVAPIVDDGSDSD